MIAQRHRFSDELVRVTKGHAAVHEIVGEVGGEQHRVGDGGRACSAIGFHTAHHSGEYSQRGLHRIHTVEDRLLVFLHVAIIGHRQAFERGQKRHQIPEHAARFSARELGDVRVFFLRHERASGRVRVADVDELKLARSPQNHILA